MTDRYMNPVFAYCMTSGQHIIFWEQQLFFLLHTVADTMYIYSFYISDPPNSLIIYSAYRFDFEVNVFSSVEFDQSLTPLSSLTWSRHQTDF